MRAIAWKNLIYKKLIAEIERVLAELERMPFWKRVKETEQERPKTSGVDLFDDLSELGLSLDSSVTDPSTALRGGILKANLRFAYANLKKGNVEQAISGASSIIVDFEKDPE